MSRQLAENVEIIAFIIGILVYLRFKLTQCVYREKCNCCTRTWRCLLKKGHQGEHDIGTEQFYE
jgi:hypothetical protein